MTALIPDHYDTRESFRAKFAAAYDDADAMADLCSGLYAEAFHMGDNAGKAQRPYGWWKADIDHLREVALNTEHTIYALSELQQAYRCAAGSVRKGEAAC